MGYIRPTDPIKRRCSAFHVTQPSLRPCVIVVLNLVLMKAGCRGGGWSQQVVNWWHVRLVGTRHQVEPTSLNPCRCEPCGSNFISCITNFLCSSWHLAKDSSLRDATVASAKFHFLPPLPSDPREQSVKAIDLSGGPQPEAQTSHLSPHNLPSLLHRRFPPHASMQQ